MRRLVWLLGMWAVMSITACASSVEEEPEEEMVFVEAEEEKEEPRPPEIVRVPVVQPAPGQARPAPESVEPTDEEIEEAIERAREEPWEVMDEANDRATAAPVEDGFYNAMQVYDYAPGLLFQVYAAQGKLTSLVFGEGERVRSVAIGDTVRWVVGRTESGSGSRKQEIVLVKPVRTGLSTNAVITTDRRVYQLELQSYRDSYMASVSWTYPREAGGGMVEVWSGDERSSEGHEVSNSRSAERDDGAALEELGVDVASLNFQYGLRVDEPEDPPYWKPVRVFDDGRRTYIEFQNGVRERELPAFFLLSRTGRPQVANYRVRGNYIVVDQVIDLAMLRIGGQEGESETVGVERLEDADG